MIDPKLNNKVAIVTGANHGIGAATAKALASQGTKIFIAYYIPDCSYSKNELEEAKRQGVGGMPLYYSFQQQSADDVVSAIRSSGGTAIAHEFDLGEVENIAKMFDLCEKEIGPVDILVNNHAHCICETFDPESVTEQETKVILTNAESIDRHFAVNARASALMMSEYLQRYIKRKAHSGRIISLTTTPAHARSVSYSASKHAMVSYSLSAAQEMGKYGITVNVVFPGATQTGYITPELERDLSARIPLGRVSQPEDTADVIVFLASKQAHWITGQIIYASGGFSG